MLARHVSTDTVAARDTFAFWQDVICETFIRLDCSSPDRKEFFGELDTRAFGDLHVSLMVSDQINLCRSRSRIASARDEYCLIVVQGRGRTVGEQDGRQVTLETDDLALFDSVRPYAAELEAGFQHFVVKIPREELRRRLGPLEAVTATRIPGSRGIGRIASAFIRALPSELDAMDDATGGRLAAMCVDLAAAALGSTVRDRAAGASSTRVAQLVRAKTYIAANLHDFDLSPAMVAEALGVSPRYLAALFADESASVARHIWRLRFDRCKAALADPRQRHRSITEIAFSWGFNDMSHFSRYFRARTGLSPREYREIAGQELRTGASADVVS